MGKLKLTSKHKRYIAAVAAVFAGLMLIDSVYQLGMHISWRIWLPTTLTTEVASTLPAAEKDKKKRSKPPKISAAIAKRNIFTKPPPKGHGMKLVGVLDNIAIFSKGGNTVDVEEGKSGHGIKVKSINDYEVVIEYKGKEETMRLFPKKK